MPRHPSETRRIFAAILGVAGLVVAAASGFLVMELGLISAPWAAAPAEAEGYEAPITPAEVSELIGSGFAVSPDTAQELEQSMLRATGGVFGDEVPYEGSGTLKVVPGSEQPPDPDRRPFTLLIRVEEGIGIDPNVFTEQVMDILNDPRGWGAIDNVSFGRTDQPGAASVTLTLASPATTQALCKHVPTGGYTSCGIVGNVNINAARWAHNADAFLDSGGSDAEYRIYLLNHEVGHLLDHWHETCPAPGELAPVMLQQTLRLDGCAPNGWPNPAAATDSTP